MIFFIAVPPIIYHSYHSIRQKENQGKKLREMWQKIKHILPQFQKNTLILRSKYVIIGA
jgi:hypothetical protein